MFTTHLKIQYSVKGNINCNNIPLAAVSFCNNEGAKSLAGDIFQSTFGLYIRRTNSATRLRSTLLDTVCISSKNTSFGDVSGYDKDRTLYALAGPPCDTGELQKGIDKDIDAEEIKRAIIKHDISIQHFFDEYGYASRIDPAVWDYLLDDFIDKIFVVDIQVHYDDIARERQKENHLERY